MSPGEVVAVITGITGLVGAIAALVGAILSARKTAYLVEYRLEQVEKKIEEHNSYAKKLSEIEKVLVGIQKDVQHLSQGK